MGADTVTTIHYPWPDSRLSPNGTRNAGLRARLTKLVRRKAADTTYDHGLGPVSDVVPIRIEMCAPSARWDDGNVRAMDKATLDGIADALGTDDRHFHPDVVIGAPRKGGAIIVTFGPHPG